MQLHTINDGTTFKRLSTDVTDTNEPSLSLPQLTSDYFFNDLMSVVRTSVAMIVAVVNKICRGR